MDDLIKRKEVLKILDEESVYNDVLNDRYDIIEKVRELNNVIMSVDLGKQVVNNNLSPVIRLFKDEFPNDVWITYCDILGIDKETANKIVSVEIEVSRVLPQIN